jgi:hypothetical protein
VKGTVFQLIGDAFHFWVVASDPKDGKVLALNITDGNKAPDSPCQIATGEDGFVTKPSAAYYKKAREFPVEALQDELRRGQNIRTVGQCSAPLLEKMITGAKQADDFTTKFLAYFN